MAGPNFWAEDFYAEELFVEDFWADQFATPPIPTPAGIKARPVQPYSVVEIDLPFCIHTYGVLPCTAKLGGTVTVNIANIEATLVPFVGYQFTITTSNPHELVEFGFVDLSGIVGSDDFDLNGERAVTFINSPTSFRIAYDGGFVAPTGSYTSGGSFVSSVANATGFKKCFNTIRTCQDRPHFLPETKTLRFCEPNVDQTFTKDSQPVVMIPSVAAINVTPSVLKPGVDIGVRESVKIGFKDHPHSDAGLDKYIEDRDYDPYQQGTFWSKLRARHVSLEGFALRVIRGQVGDDLNEADVYNYVVDSIVGQGENCSVSAKDFLILTDKKKAQCPRISNGVLSADIDANDTTITLLPIGVGDAEYPLTGKVAIGGEEVVSFTRAGDVLTVVRGRSNTVPDDHKEGDIVQLVKIYEPQGPADIIYNLLTQFCPGIDTDWINANEWEVEVDQYVGRLYSAEIAEPTSVVTLINELIEQVGLVFWADPLTQQIRLRSLRPVTTSSKIYSEDQIMPSLRVTEQTQLRVSEVWTYYGQRNPLEQLDEPSNFTAAIASIDANATQDYQHPAIKKVFSRWIASNNRAAAARLNGVILARYRDPPRKFDFELFSTIEEVPTLAAGVQVRSHQLQDDEGAQVNVPVQITSIEVAEDQFTVAAQEAIFVEQDDLETVKLLFIDDVVLNLNMRELHDEIYLPPNSGDQVRAIIGATGLVGSAKASRISFDVGEWPEGVSLELIVNEGGEIIGKGGNAGNVPSSLGAAEKGGTAFRTRVPITIKNSGKIRGGGGGGGPGGGINVGVDPAIVIKGGGGGGGAGHKTGFGGQVGGDPGKFSQGGDPGSYSNGVASSTGGEGGAPGQPGASGNTGLPGGEAGTAIDGDSFVTYDPAGTITGPRIN